jgi:two-component system NtrC family sensor kinase
MKNLKETQDQLIQAAKLAAIGELAATVAHELNNPLTTILGYTELIREEEISEGIKKDLEIIEAECLRARDIVRQLLEFSRKRPLQLIELDINDTLQEVIKFLSPNIKKSSIKLLTEFSPLPNTLADKDQIKQVFLNLINNAVQAMPEGGVLTIKTGIHDSNIFIEVSDTGIGIPKEILPRIFEPFFTTKKEKGTGLGLSISYRIVESHGGKIYVKSQKGKGTTFKVILPVKKHA